MTANVIPRRWPHNDMTLCIIRSLQLATSVEVTVAVVTASCRLSSIRRLFKTASTAVLPLRPP